MVKKKTLSPRKVDESLQGRILQKLISAKSTIPEIAHYASSHKRNVWVEIISLHHMGVIEPEAPDCYQNRSNVGIYSSETLWSISDHGMHHSTQHAGCMACRVRKRMLELAGGFLYE